MAFLQVVSFSIDKAKMAIILKIMYMLSTKPFVLGFRAELMILSLRRLQNLLRFHPGTMLIWIFDVILCSRPTHQFYTAQCEIFEDVHKVQSQFETGMSNFTMEGLDNHKNSHKFYLGSKVKLRR